MTTNKRSDPARLARFEVIGLFDEFDYCIHLSREQRITAIIAPNGTGKTVCLRLINALFARRWSVFKTTTFHTIRYYFSDGRKLEVQKGPSIHESADSPSFFYTVRFVADTTTGLLDLPIQVDWLLEFTDIPPPRVIQIERHIPFITRTGATRWMHDETGQTFSLPELIDTFSDYIPQHLLIGLYSPIPPMIEELLNAVDCRLIETQRLLILPTEDRRNYRTDQRARSSLAIAQKAQTLKKIIAENLANYATLSQTLDRSFPRRVIQQSHIRRPENLIKDLQELEEEQKNLIAAGILGSENADPVNLPPGEIEIAVARLLSVYVSDNKQKISSLRPLLSKVNLFIELVDERFRRKTTIVDKEVGFRIQSGGYDIPLEQLSSGEQHQLVLFFELLFEIEKNALILIDEPELSLHVSWQRKFIPDLQRIIGLNEFDVILATHSPQLVGHWPELIVELGERDGAEEEIG